MTRRLPGIALALVLGTLLVACGVPAGEKEPRDIAADNVQFDLLAPSSSTTSTTLSPADVRTVEVFLVRNEQLAAVERRLPADVNADDVVRELLIGTRDRENRQGYGTAIPEGTELLGAALDESTLTLDLSEELNAVQGERQMTAIAQIVFTATELPAVDGVRFQIEGTSVEVPKGDGTLTSRAVRRADYPDLDRGQD